MTEVLERIRHRLRLIQDFPNRGRIRSGWSGNSQEHWERPATARGQRAFTLWVSKEMRPLGWRMSLPESWIELALTMYGVIWMAHGRMGRRPTWWR